jgi:hypothetical protein
MHLVAYPPKALVMDGGGRVCPPQPASILSPFTMLPFAGGSAAPSALTQGVVAAGSESYFLGFLGRYPSGRVLRLLVGFFFW